MSVPGAVQLASGRIPWAQQQANNQSITADKTDWTPIWWLDAQYFGLTLSGNTIDRRINTLKSLDEGFSQVHQYAPNPAGKKKFQLTFTSGMTGLLRLIHESGIGVTSNQLLCPDNVSIVMKEDDVAEMMYWNSRWIISTVSYSPCTIDGTVGAAQIGWNPTRWARAQMVRMSSAAVRDLHGLECIGIHTLADNFLGVHKRKTLININASDAITLRHESDTETAPSNRIIIPGGDLALGPNEQVDVWFDVLTSRWRVL